MDRAYGERNILCAARLRSPFPGFEPARTGIGGYKSNLRVIRVINYMERKDLWTIPRSLYIAPFSRVLDNQE